MLAVSPEISAAQVLQAFHRDAAYLFLGAAFVTVGLVSAGFGVIRRRFDPLLFYFALFAILYGLRMWVQASLLQITISGSPFYPRLRAGINYLVPIPAFLFFYQTGFMGPALRRVSYLLGAIWAVLAILTFAFGPLRIYDLINNAIVIGGLVPFAFQMRSRSRESLDMTVIRRGLYVFIALALWDNLVGAFQLNTIRVEPFGFAVLLSALGYVVAHRSLQQSRQLSNIQQELEVAQRIQRSILPPEFPGSGYLQVAARYIPMTSVAGDFYDYIVADQEQAGILVADVSGHGVPAALIASMVKLAAAAQRSHAASPADLLAGMNAALLGNTQNQFVTAAYVHVDSRKEELRYAAAGHPPMLLLRGGTVVKVEENGLILAAFGEATYSNATVRLQPGDRMVLYTDGIVEAANAAGDFFGNESLCSWLIRTGSKTPGEAADLIIDAVRKWSRIQDDDLTLLVCDYLGRGPSPCV
jgi:sigma-B regulation protein RsbU (phosphoserine phosphatase)